MNKGVLSNIMYNFYALKHFYLLMSPHIFNWLTLLCLNFINKNFRNIRIKAPAKGAFFTF